MYLTDEETKQAITSISHHLPHYDNETLLLLAKEGFYELLKTPAPQRQRRLSSATEEDERRGIIPLPASPESDQTTDSSHTPPPTPPTPPIPPAPTERAIGQPVDAIRIFGVLETESRLQGGLTKGTLQYAFALANLRLIVRDMALTLLEKRYKAQQAKLATTESAASGPEEMIDIEAIKVARDNLNQTLQKLFPEMSWFRAFVAEPFALLSSAGLTAYAIVSQFAPEWFMEADEETSVSNRHGDVDLAAIIGAAGLTFYTAAKQIKRVRDYAVHASHASTHQEVENAVAEMSDTRVPPRRHPSVTDLFAPGTSSEAIDRIIANRSRYLPPLR